MADDSFKRIVIVYCHCQTCSYLDEIARGLYTSHTSHIILHTFIHAYILLGGSVTLQFAESDATGMESASLVEVTVRVQGRSTEILTVNVIPLTKDMYLATPGMYRNSCNSVISDAAIRGIDPARR